MANIYDLANELERSLRALPEYQKAQASREAINGDAAAKALFEEFTAFQEQVFSKMQAGTMPTAEEQAQMQDFATKIEENPVLKAYLEAQQGLSVYVADLEKIIFAPLRELAK